MNNLRILSLLPAATEMVYLLGLEKYLVGVSHECDYPPQVKHKPRVTASRVSNTMSSGAIDNEVKKVDHRGSGVFHIKKGILKKLRPNLILTQELCEACAITPPVILRSETTKDPKIISLEPESVDDILDNILLIGESSGKSQESRKIVKTLRKRLKILDSRLSILATKRPKVLVVEWLSPIMVAGHWVPEMVEIAGGKNLLTSRGSRSKIVELDQLVSTKVDILVISPCGFDIKRTKQEMPLINKIVKAIKPGKVEFIDGNAYMTRPGPRIISGIEILASMIHPDMVEVR